MSVASEESLDRPLRADARRNHQAIVAAARAAFAAQGPEVALDEVARRAGVGPSTLYRRFAGREELVAAVLEDLLTERIEPLLARAAQIADPWAALVTMLEGLVAGVGEHRSLLRAAKLTGALTPAVGRRVLEPLAGLVARGREAGVLRDDLDVADLPRVVLMAVSTIGPPDTLEPAADWRRYLALLLDGLRPSPHALPPRAGACG